MSKTNINDFLVEGYRSAAPNGTVTSQDRLQEVFRDVDTRAMDRELDFNELDYKHLFERIMPKQVFDLFNSSGRIQSKEQLKPLRESAEAAIKASYFDQFLDRCVTRQMAQFTCDMAPTLLRGLATRVDAPCSSFNDRKLCEFPMDPPPDLCGKSEEDEEPARFYQLGRQRCRSRTMSASALPCIGTLCAWILRVKCVVRLSSVFAGLTSSTRRMPLA